MDVYRSSSSIISNGFVSSEAYTAIPAFRGAEGMQIQGGGGENTDGGSPVEADPPSLLSPVRCANGTTVPMLEVYMIV